MSRSRTTDPWNDPAWDALMKSDRGCVFGAPPWIATIADTYGFSVAAWALVDGDERPPRAAIAYSELHDFLGDRIISLPFCDYLDPVVDSDDDWRELVAPLLARGCPVQLRVRDSAAPRRDTRFAETGTLFWHGSDLDRSEEDVHAGLDPGLRQNLRSARRRGVTVHFGSDLDDVRTFYDLHLRTRKRKYRLLAQPPAFFENMWKHFTPFDGMVIGTACHDGDVIAAALYLVWRGVMYYKCGASIAERLAVRPNELLAWESMRLAKALGCDRYDWGVSDVDQPGLVNYKRKFATDERCVTVLRHTPAGWSRPPDAAEMLGDLTNMLTRDDVPDDVTRDAGEILYRYFT